MIYPRFPEPGDTLGICAPSAGVGYKLDSFQMSENTFEDIGFNVAETDSVRNDDIRSCEPEQRGIELNALFEDSSIAAVIAAAGGDYNYEILPYVDWSSIYNNPKWFAGYSDPTTISYCITTLLDIATIYGFNAGSFDCRPLHDFQENALSILLGDIQTQYSYDYWDGRDQANENHEMSAPVYLELYKPHQDELNNNELDVYGRILGGCIEIIENLAGTEFEDTNGFIDRYYDDGIIWYFDVFSLDPMNLYIKMLKLKYMGYFRNARAVVFGRVMYCGEHTDEEYLDNLVRVFDDIPFIWNADIGHTKPSWTLINGSLGHLMYEDGSAALEMYLE